MKTNVIVVGAGPAGCYLSKKLSECGLNVLLLESKREVGFDWDIAIEKSAFGETNLQLPPKNLWLENPDKRFYFAIDKKNSINVPIENDDEVFLIHKDFSKYLLEKAIISGVKFLPNHTVRNLSFNKSGDILQGVSGTHKIKKIFGKELEIYFEYKADFIVDASGISGIIRKQLPGYYMLRNKIEKEEYVYAWMEERQLNKNQVKQFEETFELLQGTSCLALGKNRAYEFMHLKKNNRVSLIFGSSIEKPATIVANEFLKKYDFLGERIRGGGRMIPLRRALDNMVGDRFLCIGDTACQVIPTMGSGVASIMYAADIATRTINKAFNRSDFSLKKLWSYNYKYQSGRGAALASFDIVRRFLQIIPLEQVEIMFDSKLLTKDMLISTFSSSAIRVEVHNALEKIIDLFSKKRLGFAQKLLSVLSDSKKVLHLYQSYPKQYNKKLYSMWRKKVIEIFNDYEVKI